MSDGFRLRYEGSCGRGLHRKASSQLWRSLPTELRKKYEDMADEDRRKYRDYFDKRSMEDSARRAAMYAGHVEEETVNELYQGREAKMRTRRGIRGGNILEFKRTKVLDELEKLDGKIVKMRRMLHNHYMIINPEPPRRKWERRASAALNAVPKPLPPRPRPMQTVPLYVTLPDPIYVGMPVGARIPEGCPGAGDFFQFQVQEGWLAGQSVMIPLQVVDQRPPSPPPDRTPMRPAVPQREDPCPEEAKSMRTCLASLEELKNQTEEISGCVERGVLNDSDADEWETLLALELDDLLSDLRNGLVEATTVIRGMREKLHGPLATTMLTEKNQTVKILEADMGAKRANFVLKHYDAFAPFLSIHNRTKDGPLARKLRIRLSNGDGELITYQIAAQPECITGGKMRDYQIEGLRWLVSQHAQGACSILGDEMGLGKTLQLVSFLGYLKHNCNMKGPHLVVAPVSVLSSWKREFGLWCPTLRIATLHGHPSERERLKGEMLRGREVDVLITSYEMLVAEPRFLYRMHWYYLVFDEAQRLKNDGTQAFGVASKLHGISKLLLTGTPLQNNFHELWSLVNFMYPDVFDTSDVFDSVSNTDRDRSVMQCAHNLLKPLMLRRLKTDVELTLPPKTETKVFLPMSKMQHHWYKGLLSRESDALAAKEGAAAASGNVWKRLQSLLMQLRKCCNHPFLFPAAEEEFEALDDEALIMSSSKMIVLDKLLARLKPDGHKVLIFSQFTKMLDLLEEYCRFRGHRYLRLDGGTTAARRQYEVNLFNKETSTYFVYLISTRAGGLGITLTAADTVILYDSDWNPTADLQAQDRAHRIGQTKPVRVYRLLTRGTVEERILQRAEQKLFVNAIVMRDDGTDDLDMHQGLGLQELLSILKFGTRVVGMQDQEDLENMDIDSILQQSDSYAAASKGGEVTEDTELPPVSEVTSTETVLSALQGEKLASVNEFEGVVYKKTNKSIAEDWSHMVGKRIRTDRVVSVGKHRVLKWSIDEADREEEALKSKALNKAPREKKYNYQSVCLGCGDEALESDQENVLACCMCPRVMHIGCFDDSKRPAHPVGWLCPQHHCCQCNKSAAQAGGLMFRCVSCPAAFCPECLPLEFEAVDGCGPLSDPAVGYRPPNTALYIEHAPNHITILESDTSAAQAQLEAEKLRKRKLDEDDDDSDDDDSDDDKDYNDDGPRRKRSKKKDNDRDYVGSSQPPKPSTAAHSYSETRAPSVKPEPKVVTFAPVLQEPPPNVEPALPLAQNALSEAQQVEIAPVQPPALHDLPVPKEAPTLQHVATEVPDVAQVQMDHDALTSSYGFAPQVQHPAHPQTDFRMDASVHTNAPQFFQLPQGELCPSQTNLAHPTFYPTHNIFEQSDPYGIQRAQLMQQPSPWDTSGAAAYQPNAVGMAGDPNAFASPMDSTSYFHHQ